MEQGNSAVGLPAPVTFLQNQIKYSGCPGQMNAPVGSVLAGAEQVRKIIQRVKYCTEACMDGSTELASNKAMPQLNQRIRLASAARSCRREPI